MDKEDYVSLDVAKLLKEKGFDEFTDSFYGDIRGLQKGSNLLYNTINKITIFVDDKLKVKKENCIAAPTLYEAQKWIRNNHFLYIEVTAYYNSYEVYENDYRDQEMVWEYSIWKDTTYDVYEKMESKGCYDTYEEALDAGILEALKLI